MTDSIRNFFTDKEWMIISDAVEEYGYIEDEDCADEDCDVDCDDTDDDGDDEDANDEGGCDGRNW